MKSIGQLIEETINLCDRGIPEYAFFTACEALNQTAQKVYEGQTIPEPAFQRFIRENWNLISFMGIPSADTIPTNLPFGLRRAIPSFLIPNLGEELIIYAVRHTLSTRRMPFEIGFSQTGRVILENERLLFPKSLLFGILSCIILNPVNKNESIPDNYWISIWDFKMFISELWGRMDIAERVMKLYLEKKWVTENPASEKQG